MTTMNTLMYPELCDGSNAAALVTKMYLKRGRTSKNASTSVTIYAATREAMEAIIASLRKTVFRQTSQPHLPVEKMPGGGWYTFICLNNRGGMASVCWFEHWLTHNGGDEAAIIHRD